MWAFYPPLATLGGPVLACAALVGLFALAELVPVRVEIRQQTWLVSMAEIPMVLGLFLVQPRSLLVCRLAAAVIVYGYKRSFVLLKRVFNLALFSLEVAIACAVFRAVGAPEPKDPWNWLAAQAAVLSFVLVGSACVYGVILLTQGRPSRRQTLTMSLQALALPPFSCVLGLIVVLLISVDPWAIVLAGATSAAAALGYRAYARVVRQREGLGQIYGFTQLLEQGRGASGALEAAVDRACELLNATTGVVALWTTDARLLATVWSTGTPDDERRTPLLTDPIVRRCVTETRGVRVTTRSGSEAERIALAQRGAHEVLTVSLGLGSAGMGLIELRDRQSAQAAFSDDDRQVLENLGTHLAAAIENQRLVDQLRHDAYHDRLTGLPNREFFTQAVDSAIAQAKSDGSVVAVLLLDLDSFKDVNDALGHDYGDQLLIMLGRRLHEHAPGRAVVARMGADEFAMLCPVDDLGAALRTAEALREALVAPYPLAGLTVEVGVSIGVTVAPEHAQNGGMLMQRADVALYHAKDSGRAVSSYLSSMDQASVHRLQLVTQLREAISAGQVQVQYQPKVALGSRDVVGVEALVRWQHPEHGMVMPDEFVPLAERTGLIDPLTRHVLRTALIECRAWLDRDTRIGVAVNLSVRNLLDVTFPDIVGSMLTEIRVPPDLLTFEITESSVMKDPERSLPVLHRLHALGVSLSIDDFGTGYSSLAYLRKLPVDEVKIDKVFVLGMGTDLGDMAIVRAIVELGRSLSLRVVAEGVEDELARELLETMGCEVVQGYMISRALPPDRLNAWLRARTSLGQGQPGVSGRRPQLTG
ncbi:MAG TPA: EAL domain-containing protein [Mycobacteriales bacterium]|nr:EAL domain-containing protein [Mycobacteriales bacterium]